MVLGVKGSLPKTFLDGKLMAGSELTPGMLRSSVQVWLGGLSLLFPAMHHESRHLAQEVSELSASGWWDSVVPESCWESQQQG